MPAPKNLQAQILDQEIAKRLYSYRIKYVDKNQKEASQKLGVSNSWLSMAESGQRPVRMEVVQKLVMDYGLNTEWFTTGNGPDRIKNPAKPTAAGSLQTIHQEVLVIKHALEIFEANLSHAYKLIEKQNMIIEDLQNQINNKK